MSLEAIFLSTFVMIGQNRQAAFQQAKADHDFVEQELELKTNTELTREIHVLTTELHQPGVRPLSPGQGTLAASTSAGRISGAVASSRSAFCSSAAAIGPSRCACRSRPRPGAR